MGDRSEIIGLFLVAFACAIVGMTGGFNVANSYWKRDAIKHGYAEYVTDELGEPKWQWKEKQ